MVRHECDSMMPLDYFGEDGIIVCDMRKPGGTIIPFR